MSSPTKAATVRNVQLQDIDIVKELTLQMLADSPQAFGETLSDAQRRTDKDWDQYVQGIIASPNHNAFVASDGLGACGFVVGDGANPQTPPGTVLVSHLWVAPRQRGTGLGRKLMNVVTKWAQEQNAQSIALGVTEMNLNAMKFYEHLEYKDTGIRFRLPWDPTKLIIILARKL